jgi:phage terminase large subunit
MNKDFVITTALKKLLKLKKRIKVIPGGTSAGKTYSIIPILIDKAIKQKGLEISIVGESIPNLRRGALKDFIKIMKATGRWIEDHYSRTLLKYTFANGSFIEFFGADQSDKLRGPRRHILYINECNNVDFESYQQLAIRTSDEVWLDFNPTHEFWVHTELNEDSDTDHLKLTYKDNEALSDSIVNEIEKARDKAETSAYWANWWKVYGLGELGQLEGVIFDNWKLIDTIPLEAELVGIGLDFGYTNDPTAIIEVYKWNGKRILNELCYRSGLVNSEIAKLLPNNVQIYADSAEPKSIEEIRRTGKNIRGVTKGADSIMFGISTMQGQEYLVTKQSTNLIKELRYYCWDKDKNGKKLNKPIDMFNHAIDAVRYHEMESVGINNKIFTF